MSIIARDSLIFRRAALEKERGFFAGPYTSSGKVAPARAPAEIVPGLAEFIARNLPPGFSEDPCNIFRKVLEAGRLRGIVSCSSPSHRDAVIPGKPETSTSTVLPTKVHPPSVA
ncbi:hypothetical protein KM043_006332 [Ampulex compressa]|nr:hypothetical protein KM043_006332 [Ampulex compressa]